MNDFENALEKSLEWVARGESVEHCLEAYPQWANELKPMLEIAVSMRQMETKLSHSADMSIRRRLLQASKKEKLGVPFRLRHWLQQPIMENLMKNVKLTAALASVLVLLVLSFQFMRSRTIEPEASATTVAVAQPTIVPTATAIPTSVPTPIPTALPADFHSSLLLPDQTVCKFSRFDESLTFNPDSPIYICNNNEDDLVIPSVTTAGGYYFDYQRGKIVKQEGSTPYFDSQWSQAKIGRVTLTDGMFCEPISPRLPLGADRLGYGCSRNSLAMGLINELAIKDGNWSVQGVQLQFDSNQNYTVTEKWEGIVDQLSLQAREPFTVTIKEGMLGGEAEAQLETAGYEKSAESITTVGRNSYVARLYQHPSPNFGGQGGGELPQLLILKMEVEGESTVAYSLQSHRLADNPAFHVGLESADDGTAIGWHDINKDGIQEIIAYAGTGGNGWLDQVVSILQATENGIVDMNDQIVLEPKFGIAIAQDIDKDGILELLIQDARFEMGFELCHACSPHGVRIYRWNGTAYVNASADFPSYYQPTIDETTKRLTTVGFDPTDASADDHVTIAELVSLLLSYENIGKSAEGWQLFKQYANPANYPTVGISTQAAWDYFRAIYEP